MKQITFIKTFYCEKINFIDYQTTGKFNLPITTIKAEKQAENWIEEQTTILDNIIHNPAKELNCILNWKVIYIKNFTKAGAEEIKETKTVKKTDIIQTLELITQDTEPLDEEFKANFKHTYEEMKDTLTGLSIEKKIAIVLSSMGVGMRAAGNAYNRMSNILDDISNDTNLIDKC